MSSEYVFLALALYLSFWFFFFKFSWFEEQIDKIANLNGKFLQNFTRATSTKTTKNNRRLGWKSLEPQSLVVSHFGSTHNIFHHFEFRS